MFCRAPDSATSSVSVAVSSQHRSSVARAQVANRPSTGRQSSQHKETVSSQHRSSIVPGQAVNHLAKRNCVFEDAPSIFPAQALNLPSTSSQSSQHKHYIIAAQAPNTTRPKNPGIETHLRSSASPPSDHQYISQYRNISQRLSLPVQPAK